MSKPFVSVIMLTYARVPLLEEAVKCYIMQRYEGRKELIIFNSFPDQELVFEHPEVKIINSKVRPASIGECRNSAIEYASGEFVILLDDDDKILPNHLENSVHGFDIEQHDWTWQSHILHMEYSAIKSIDGGTYNVVAYTRRAWKELGGFHALNVGEDASFVGRLTARFKGVKVQLAKNEISYIYSRGQESSYNISGQGVAGNDTALQRVEAFTRERVKSGLIKTGHIVLEPKLLLDYPAMAASFTNAVKRFEDDKIGKVSLVMLGRYGDITNILPVAKAIHDRWGSCIFYVSKHFAGILDGVSYVTPRILDIPYDRINEAVVIANQECQLVINCQVWGHNFATNRETGAYNTDSWQLAGFLKHFNDNVNFPLVFDQRGPERELALWESLPLDDRPVILVNVGSGLSVPFHDYARFFTAVNSKWGNEFNIVDISDVNKVPAHRIYDLLGLFDRACLLITSDTATLHLAAASDVPVIALVGNDPWLSSVTRCNCVLRLRYAEAFSGMEKVNAVIEKLQELCIA